MPVYLKSEIEKLLLTYLLYVLTGTITVYLNVVMMNSLYNSDSSAISLFLRFTLVEILVGFMIFGALYIKVKYIDKYLD
ncbi:hypothetical protein QGN29_01695 [Temperatibacter marinus]|uniref:Uncharacterized protein n=1 Tax=Temperatibacter marinus TaxID=1456591 RepID=A0AA52ECU0_9PROT|nr:hypothetical protein [Temperatibacter marinus]WND03077.1 hypothetical protein QGN29_01695 [Temperatibacter marinus]